MQELVYVDPFSEEHAYGVPEQADGPNAHPGQVVDPQDVLGQLAHDAQVDGPEQTHATAVQSGQYVEIQPCIVWHVAHVSTVPVQEPVPASVAQPGQAHPVL
jgi:hypothetical protein